LACEEKASGTKFDRYFIDEFTKKIKVTDEIEIIIEKVRGFSGSVEEFKSMFEDIINQY
jgi:hypothetical protein